MNRREFTVLLGGPAASSTLWPQTARAQTTGKMRRLANKEQLEAAARIAASNRKLEEQGWIEGRNLRIDYRFGDSDATRIRAATEELIGLRSDRRPRLASEQFRFAPRTVCGGTPMIDRSTVSRLPPYKERTMKKTLTSMATGFAAVMLFVHAGLVEAAEIKVLCAEAMKSVFNDLARDFERASGDKVTAAYATAGVLANRIRGGEPTDGVIMPRSVFSPLVNEGQIVSASATRVAQSPLAVAVPAGASKPDISTVEAFKRTLLTAKSMTYPDPTKGGAIGIQAARVIDRLGLTAQLKSRTTLTLAGEFREILEKGQAELAIVLPVAVVDYPGIDLVGALPSELQNTELDFMAGIDAHAKEPAAAKALIEYLLSPAAARVIKARGLEPG